MEEGYFSFQLEELQLSLLTAPEKDLILRVDVEILNGLNVYRWKSVDNTKFQTSTFQPVRQEGDSPVYVFGFDSIHLQSTFIELNNDVINGLANATVSVKLINVLGDSSTAAAAPPAKNKKDAPVVAAPTEEVLLDVALSFAELLQRSRAECQVSAPVSFFAYTSLPKIVTHHSVSANDTTFAMSLSADDCLAEYVLGCNIIRWKGAQLFAPPPSWTLHAADVVDPKAKVPPTAAELRSKYLQNIATCVQNQQRIASFTLNVGGVPTSDFSASQNIMTAAAEVESEEVERNEDVTKELQRLLPELTFSAGLISFDAEAAAAVPVDEDIRARGDLWTLDWSWSSSLFLHRSTCRKLSKLISVDPSRALLPLTMRKIPTAESIAVEGGELFATAVLDLSPLMQCEELTEFVAVLTGEGFESSRSHCPLQLLSSRPIVEKNLVDREPAPQSTASAFCTSDSPNITGQQPNRDVLSELRSEIALCIERIAQEYVSLYPQAPATVGNANVGNESPSRNNSIANLDDKKKHFLEFLTTSGVFHDLQDKLRPKLMLIIKDRYGKRGRALGKSETMRAVDSSINESIDLQALLSELYAFIMKQCTLVLNSLFSATIVQRDRDELENPACVDDEIESPKQRFDRLGRQADDCEADRRPDAANALHLQRLALLDREPSLGRQHSLVHSAYLHYAEFLLRRSASELTNKESAVTIDDFVRQQHDEWRGLAREALQVAAKHAQSHWQTHQLLAAVLAESQQMEQAEEMMLRVLAMQLDDEHQYFSANSFKDPQQQQLRSSSSRKRFGLESLEDISGYESDSLTPTHPRCFAVLAGLFAMQQKPLLVRKALLLANRSYVEGDFESSVADYNEISEHGTPRRTLVLVLAECSCFLAQYGLFSVAQALLSLADDCDSAAVAKAQARNKPAKTPAHVATMLARARAEVFAGTCRDAVDASSGASMLCNSSRDLIKAKLCQARALARNNESSTLEIVDCYVLAVREYHALHESQQLGKDENLLPLFACIELGKLLTALRRYEDAAAYLLLCSRWHSSATLCSLLGENLFRLDSLDEAEKALLESNLLLNTDARCWSLLCLVLLAKGAHRLAEAEQCLFQTLRLQLLDAELLVELAKSFIGVDRFATAEDLIRRAIAIDVSSGGSAGGGRGRGAGARYRALLADVLAGQNNAADAVQQYKEVLSDNNVDMDTQLQVAYKCKDLLSLLGREDEERQLAEIIVQLSNMALTEEQ